MNILPKILITICFLLFAQFDGYTQPIWHIRFDYDGAGNRILREYVFGAYPKPGKPQEADTMIIGGQNEVLNTALQLKVYPNPFHEILFVENLNLQEAEKNSIQVYDISGKLITSSSQTETKQGIDLKNVPPGTYYLNYYSNNTLVKTWKLVKI